MRRSNAMVKGEAGGWELHPAGFLTGTPVGDPASRQVSWGRPQTGEMLEPFGKFRGLAIAPSQQDIKGEMGWQG